MMKASDILREFPPVGKQEWLQQIGKDLKGKALEELEWQVSADLRVSPFVHSSDFPETPQPLWESPKNWELCERISVEDVVNANAQALEALNGGAESLDFYWPTSPGSANFQQVLQGIHPDFIGLHFSGPGTQQNPAGLFALLMPIVQQRGLDTGALHGTLAYSPNNVSGISDWRYAVDLLEFVSGQFPRFNVLEIAVQSDPSPVKSLADALKTADYHFRQLSERGVSAASIAAHLFFSVTIGKHYFVEIARLRALHLLWFNLLKAWNAPVEAPAIAAAFQPEAYTDDLYTNMIRATTMGMSAALGGADRLTVLPYDAGREQAATYPQAFGRRIARNVQHLMKMESHINEKADVAAGSYYIESLTQQIAASAWAEFTQA